MLRFIVKRILLLFPVILGIVFIVFAIMSLTPGDPARAILGDKVPQEQVDALREEMGLNDPFFVQYVRYTVNLFTGNMGRSYMSRIPVMENLMSKFPNTAKLALSGMLLSVLIGIPIGVLSAVKQYTAVDSASIVFALLLASIPGFWLGLMLILLFSLRLDLLPSSGYSSFSHMILPAVTLASVNSAAIVRMTRSSMLEVIRQDFIRTARAKGASEKRVIFRHALKNSIIPIITVIGVNFGILLGGAVLTETVFAIPGVGRLMVDSIRNKDNPMVLASVVFIGVAFSLVNLCIDIIYTIIDPRLRT